MKIIVTIDTETMEAKVTSEETQESIITRPIEHYDRFFDGGSKAWTKDSAYNKMFLLTQQRYADDLLRARGHLYLNEVYDMLGIPRTKAGQVMGWLWKEGVNVDFGLGLERNKNFVDGLENVALLRFNVTGRIIDEVY